MKSLSTLLFLVLLTSLPLQAKESQGETILFSSEFYQPLDLHSRYFLAPHIGYRDHEILTVGPEFPAENAVGFWRVRRLGGELSDGVNLFDNTQLRPGLFRYAGKYRTDVEINASLPEEHFEEGGGLAHRPHLRGLWTLRRFPGRPSTGHWAGPFSAIRCGRGTGHVCIQRAIETRTPFLRIDHHEPFFSVETLATGPFSINKSAAATAAVDCLRHSGDYA